MSQCLISQLLTIFISLSRLLTHTLHAQKMSSNTTTPTWVFPPIETLPLDYWEPSVNSADGGSPPSSSFPSQPWSSFQSSSPSSSRYPSPSSSQLPSLSQSSSSSFSSSSSSSSSSSFQPSFPSESSPSIVSSSSGYNIELDPIFAFLTELHPQDSPPLDVFSQPCAFDFEWDDATKYAIDEWTASQMNEGIFDGYNYQMARNIDGDFAATIAPNAHNQFVTCQDMLSSESPVQTASVQNGNVTHATKQMHAVATPVDHSLQPTISLPQQTSASKATRRKTTKKVAKPRKTRSKGKENAPPTARAKATSSTPVACLFPNCPKSYADARERNRHMLIHFPFQFVCQEAGCTKAFSRGDLLRRHWRDQHQTNEDDRSNYTSPKPAFPWDVDPEAFNKLRTPSSDVTDKTGKFVLRAKTNPQFYASHFRIYQSS